MCSNFSGDGWQDDKILKQATRPTMFKWRQTAAEVILRAVRW